MSQLSLMASDKHIEWHLFVCLQQPEEMRGCKAGEFEKQKDIVSTWSEHKPLVQKLWARLCKFHDELIFFEFCLLLFFVCNFHHSPVLLDSSSTHPRIEHACLLCERLQYCVYFHFKIFIAFITICVLAQKVCSLFRWSLLDPCRYYKGVSLWLITHCIYMKMQKLQKHPEKLYRFIFTAYMAV